MVMLHGGPAGNDYLEILLPELDGFDAVRYQQRGVPPATTEGPHTVEEHVADLIRVLDTLGLQQPWLLGHSWGGHLAMHALVRAPGRFAAAVIVDPLGPVPESPGAFEGMLKRGLSEAELARLKELDRLEQEGLLTDEQALESVQIVWPNYHHDRDSPPPNPLTRLNAAASTETWASINHHYEAHTLAKGLPSIDIPVMFVHGESSPIDPEHSRAGRRLMPAAELMLVPDAGHFPWVEQPGCVADTIERLRLRMPLASLDR
jgi:proline iminopeptidase